MEYLRLQALASWAKLTNCVHFLLFLGACGAQEEDYFKALQLEDGQLTLTQTSAWLTRVYSWKERVIFAPKHTHAPQCAGDQ